MALTTNAMLDGMIGLAECIEGLVKINLPNVGLGTAALLTAAGQGWLVRRQIGVDRTLSMMPDHNGTLASVFGGATGATASLTITQIMVKSFPAYSKTAVFVIGIPIRMVSSLAVGFVATAVFVIAIDGAVATVNKIREWRQPPPAILPV